MSAVACKLALPLLSALRQPIRSTGPSSHQAKAGTPTAAGCVFMPLACAVTCAYIPTTRVMCACGFIMAASAVGLVDDYFTVNPLSLDRRGLTAQEQLFIQTVSGLLLATAAPSLMPQHLISTASTGDMAAVSISLTPWISIAVSPVLYHLLCVFTYVSEVNAVNLTDGLDGLAATCTALVLSGAGMGLHASGCQDLQALCASLSGAVCGFYMHNRHPAAAFMGNCGSHGLGAAIAAVAALGGAHGVVGLLSAVLAVEAGSTAVQLGWFSWTKRRFGEGVRLLRMAPLHHHLEMCGWHEVAVVAAATAVQAALVTLVAGMWR